MQDQTHYTDDPEIRDVVERHRLADCTVTMISDPLNAHAWIQSDVTVQIEA